MLNKWLCFHAFEGCEGYACGYGAPIGLRALGWFVEESQQGSGVYGILCPHHHPQGFVGASDQASVIQRAPIVAGARWFHPVLQPQEFRANAVDVQRDTARLDALEQRLKLELPPAPKAQPKTRKKKRVARSKK